jgi:hypothetical protein
MLKALDRNIASAESHVVFVAPSASSVSDMFRNVEVDGERHRQLIRDVQRMRGSIYLKDGAVARHQLTADGLHQTEEDETSWHMLLLNKHQQVTACALYLEHDNTVTFDQLRARQCPLASQEEWRPKLVDAIESELERSRQEGLKYIELGGWAVAEQSRGTAGPLALALATYGFSRRAGGALGITTATFRHCSATILKRLGGSRLESDGVTLPPYYDKRYRCMMEMIRFDSRQPNVKYLGLIDQFRDMLANIMVVTRPSAAEEAFNRFSRPSSGFVPAAMAS